MNNALTTTRDDEASAGEYGGPSDHEKVSTANLILQPGALEKLEKFAVLMAKGHATVPQHLRGNVGDCMAVCLQAAQWGMNPFAVAQKTHLINGALGYEAQLVNAALNSIAPTKDRIHYEWFGPWEKIVGKFKTVESRDKKDDAGKAKTFRVPDWDARDEEGLGIRVYATLKGENEPRVLELLMTQARTRNSTLWTEDPKQQIAYLATKRWARLYCPDVILGVYTPDEMDDRQPRDMGAAVVVDDKPTLDQETLAKWRAASEKGTREGRVFWRSLDEKKRALASQELRDEMWELAVAADKARTVDNPKADADSKPATKDQPPEPKPGQVDPDTGEITQQPGASSAETAEFVAELEEAERQQQAKP